MKPTDTREKAPSSKVHSYCIFLPKPPFTPKSRTVNQSQQPEIDQLREEIVSMRKQLERCQKMTALGELVSTTTHEFNNVLMTIMNYAKMGMRYDDKETRDKAFDKINQASNRAAKITNSVLGMARNRSEHFEQTDLKRIIDETMVLLERELQKYRIAVEMELGDSVPEVSAIGNQVQQVLLNLLINARQAMPDGGRLLIKLSHDKESNTANLSVRDFGTGMDTETMQRIFEPYFSTKEGPDESGKGGTGLGLAACKNIIEAHGGKFRVESAIGKGTNFTIMLPVDSQKSPVIAARGIAGAMSQMNAGVSSVPQA